MTIKVVLAEALSRQVYPRYNFSEFGRLIKYHDDFVRYYNIFVVRRLIILDCKYTFTSR